jgi:biotin carboxyl carrier protein
MVPVEAVMDTAVLEELHGERLAVPERVIIAPRIGQFRSAPADVVTAEGEIIAAGQVVGFVDAQGELIPVRSAFRGWMMGLLVHEGERVREGQPVAWLRAL